MGDERRRSGRIGYAPQSASVQDAGERSLRTYVRQDDEIAQFGGGAPQQPGARRKVRPLLDERCRILAALGAERAHDAQLAATLDRERPHPDKAALVVQAEALQLPAARLGDMAPGAIGPLMSLRKV